MLVPFLFIAAAGTVSAPAGAQTQSTDNERRAVFLELLADPANRTLMRTYAQMSIRAEDYEAAIGTLERLIDLEPGNAAARFELAQAYFALGAYELADFHLEVLEASDGLSDADRATLAAYRSEARARSTPNRISGRISFGGAYSEAAESVAAIGSAQLTWRRDLGGRHAADWITSAFVSAQAAGNDEDRQFARLRSGPEFRLSQTAFGPRLQPFVQLTALRDADGTDLNELALGFGYQNPHTARITSFADAYVGAAEETDGGTSVTLTDATIGVAMASGDDANLRLSVNHRREMGDVEDRTMLQGRLGLVYRFDAPVPTVTRDWSIGATASFAQVDVTGGPNARNDDILRLGVSMRAFVSEAAYLEGRATVRNRTSTLAGFDADDTVLSLALGWEF